MLEFGRNFSRAAKNKSGPSGLRWGLVHSLKKLQILIHKLGQKRVRFSKKKAKTTAVSELVTVKEEEKASAAAVIVRFRFSRPTSAKKLKAYVLLDMEPMSFLPFLLNQVGARQCAFAAVSSAGTVMVLP